jgi:hemolysin III
MPLKRLEPESPASGFPRYGRGEEIADRCIHVLGVAGGVGAAATLLTLAADQGSARIILATGIYAFGLLAMLLCSALYNLAPPSPRKEWLRRLDRAAIFVMIFGTYTPFLLGRIGGWWGMAMFAFVLLAAAVGAVAAVAAPRRFERLQLAGYLLLGWSILGALGPLLQTVPWQAILLLVVGGLLYNLGVVFHLSRRLGFHNAIWHGFVLAAAGCHYAAVMVGVVLPATGA